MLTPLMGTLMLMGPATAAAGVVTVVLMPNNPPLSLSRLCAVLALTFGASAAVMYCYGWFSLTLAGPFPALCEERSPSGARLTAVEQEHWPLRSACLYSDGPTVEHISMSVNVLTCLLAGLSLTSACAGPVLRRRASSVVDY